jgi:hypothetical protein
MRNRFTFVVVSLVSVSVVVAGPAPAIEIDAFGAKAGAAYVWPDFQYEGAEVIDPGSILAPSVGVYLELRRSRHSRFNFLIEAKYTRKGYEADRSELVPDDPNPPREVTASYLSVPVLFRSNVRDGTLSLFLIFGPSLEILLSTDDDPILNNYNDFALAGYAGLGFEYELNRSTSLTFELRFNAEFTNAYDSGEDDPLSSVSHRVLELLGGVRF